MNDKERNIARYFDQCAEAEFVSIFTPEQEVKLQLFLQQWNIRSGESVLEPGCGAGRLTERLGAPAGAGGRVLGFDLSPEMIRKAFTRRLPGNSCCVVASVMAIPARPEAFDAVICLNAFPHFGDPAGALRQMAACLKPGGRFWINHFDNRAGVNRRHMEAGEEVRGHLLASNQEIALLLETAGLTLVTIEDSEQGFRVQARKR
jgi:ubiquinone/menaquinone biosynthesis C-methylase UbiE